MNVAGTTAFRHEAILYRGGGDGFVQAVMPMVGEALQAGGTAAIAAPPDRLARVGERLGAEPRVALLDMTSFGVNPGRIIPVWRALADEALALGVPFLGVGEPAYVGRSPDELEECHCHETLINEAFGSDPEWRLVCPYDVDALDPVVVEGARHTHPTVIDPDGTHVAGAFDGAEARETLDRPLSPTPHDASTFAFAKADIALVREIVARHADRLLPADRVADLVLAATELATNAVRHGDGRGTLRVWRRDGQIVCQTEDAGRITDPLVGRRRPAIDGPSGRGLWIVHQLCDLVQVRSSERGTVVRIAVG